ncbi:MAG: right-handed parallel beta-helix repeat-containing protein [Novosphingobium sp.]
MSESVQVKFNRRTVLQGTALGMLGLSGRAFAQQASFTPEQFGAKGDGFSNDTRAFARLSAAVAARGGGRIVLRKTTYIVGLQGASGGARSDFSFQPEPILKFDGLTSGLTIIGNGARLKCAGNLRFGTFDRGGRKTSNPMPFLRRGELATPYIAMIAIERCRGAIELRDIELDGNAAGLTIGGQYGDVGWQIPAMGLLLRDNPGNETVIGLHSHHHALDGVQIDGLDGDRPGAPECRFENVRCEYNGRQGVSLVGGRRYLFRNCKFNHTGRGPLMSAPAAGFDIEAEGGKKVRQLRFETCEFANNGGAGMVADSGDSADVSFTSCTFIGTTNWAAWPNKPRFRFQGCRFVGSICNAYGSDRADLAVQFRDCTFRDVAGTAGYPRIYGSQPSLPIADLSSSENVLFERCQFQLTAGAVLPWSVKAIYSDCTMSQVSARESYPRGTFRGSNVISGRIGLSGSRNLGEVIANGRRVVQGAVP